MVSAPSRPRPRRPAFSRSATVGAVLHIGVAGGRGLEVGSLVVGSEAIYCDLSARSASSTGSRPTSDSSQLREGSSTEYRSIPIGTSAAVGGVDRDLAVEAMEGFGVLRAAALAGVPALEVRAISNEIGESDAAGGEIDDAVAALSAAVPGLVAAIASTTRLLTVRSRSMARPRYPSSSGPRPPRALSGRSHRRPARRRDVAGVRTALLARAAARPRRRDRGSGVVRARSRGPDRRAARRRAVLQRGVRGRRGARRRDAPVRVDVGRSRSSSEPSSSSRRRSCSRGSLSQRSSCSRCSAMPCRRS